MESRSAKPENIKVSAIIGIVSLALGLIFNFFFYEKIPGLGVLVYVLLIILGFFIISWDSGKKQSREAMWLFIPLIFFSAMVFVRASAMLVVLDIIAVLLLMLVIASISSGKKLQMYILVDYIKILFAWTRFFEPFYKTVANLTALVKPHQNPEVAAEVNKGIAITVPVIILFLLLFSSADLMFREYLTHIFNWPPDTIPRLFWIIFMTCTAAGSYAYIFGDEDKDENEARDRVKVPKVGNIESAILFGSVNVLFLLFIIIQFTYLFGGHSNIADYGYTYAEYARRGFGELSAVAIISLLLLLAFEYYVRKPDSEHTPSFKLLSTALVVQVSCIMVSAFLRLYIYEQAYGFTTLRLYSHAFIIWLAVIFLLVVLKIFFDKRDNPFAFRAFVSMILFLAAMNFLNPDSFIANRNLDRYYSKNKLDIYYLGNLSDDSVPGLIKAIEGSQDERLLTLNQKLFDRYSSRENYSYYQGWQSLNLSRINAERLWNTKFGDAESQELESR
ncbi:MAG TPA: DUF4173 domain-containing protein [bacterium]